MERPKYAQVMLQAKNPSASMGILHQKLYQSEHLAFIEMKIISRTYA